MSTATAPSTYIVWAWFLLVEALKEMHIFPNSRFRFRRSLWRCFSQTVVCIPAAFSRVLEDWTEISLFRVDDVYATSVSIVIHDCVNFSDRTLLMSMLTRLPNTPCLAHGHTRKRHRFVESRSFVEGWLIWWQWKVSPPSLPGTTLSILFLALCDRECAHSWFCVAVPCIALSLRPCSRPSLQFSALSVNGHWLTTSASDKMSDAHSWWSWSKSIKIWLTSGFTTGRGV